MKTYLYLLLFIFLINISCIKSKEVKKNTHNIIFNDSIDIVPGLIKIKLNTLNFIKNKYSFGQLFYTIPKDTLNQNKIEKRLIVFVISGDSKAYDFESILNTADDALVDSTSINTIYFSFKYKFSEIGKQELKIGVKDIIYLKRKDSLFMETLTSSTIYKVSTFVKDSV